MDGKGIGYLSWERAAQCSEPICLRLGAGSCEVELSLIEDYLLNYSSTARLKQPWIKETSVRQTFGSTVAFN